MRLLIRNELKKIFKMNLVRVIFCTAFVFSLFSLLSGQSKSAYYVPISALSNLTQSLAIVCFACFTSYIYGIELQNKTLKILKSKSIKEEKFIGGKFLAAIISIIIFMAFIGICIFAIAAIKLPLTEFSVAKLNVIIPESEGLKTIVLSYILEIMPVCLVAFTCMTLTICFNSSIIGIASTIAIFLLSKLVESVKVIRFLLPSYHLTIWSQYIENKGFTNILLEVLIMILYCSVLFFISVSRYKRLQVK